jgi:geranylgeranyl pyrophosphate synthase/predicted secreted hydrolase
LTARPRDWPTDGPIDLALHDPPHASAGIEWWYVNAHLAAVDGHAWSLFAAFFRLDAGEDAPSGARRHRHYLTWALVDVAGRRYLYDTLLDPSAPDEGLRRLDRGRGGYDPRMRRALREVFARGHVPRPDRLLRADAAVRLDGLDLDYDGNRFVKGADGAYRLTLLDAQGAVGCDLVFHPTKAATRHGAGGVTSAGTDHEMFYYFISRCRVGGTVTLAGSPIAVASGEGWYDHEFGSVGDDDAPGLRGLRWNWIGVQLDDGSELSAFEIIDSKDGSKVTERRVIVVDANGARGVHADFTLEPASCWTSFRTFNKYPTQWRFEVPALDLSLVVEAEFGGQEYVTILWPPAFWEGRVRAHGTKGGLAVAGLGFVERTGFSQVHDLDDFFSAVGRATRSAIDALLPATLTRDAAERLLTDEEHRHHLEGFDVDEFGRSVLAPIRELTHRGGKAWRSYGVLASIEAVGGDPQRYAHWLALPELLHTGSLIIDDVQDQSEVRRGGPSCHKVHGEAIAINAGCAAYFLAQAPLLTDALSDAERVRIYEAYFQAMRAAHAGQALDIRGLDPLMPAVVETGEAAPLEAQILAIHRLKSAVPPAALARVAAFVGGGTKAQIEGIGDLFESFGLAFQIVDDTLNLRGFQGELKVRGEDIRAGKITLPVAKAMSRLGKAERRALWEGITSRPTDPTTITRLIETIAACGALDACDAQARGLVESAWDRLNSLIADSHVKLRLRSFGWFVLERHY